MTLQSEVKQQVELPSLLIWRNIQKLLIILEHSALEKRVPVKVADHFITRDALSTESLQDLWHREVTSQLEMALEVRASMEPNLQTRP